MFRINGVQWYIKFVRPNDPNLRRDNGSLAIGMCDRNRRTIYINETLRGEKLKRVLCHEVVHASMFSYGIKLDHDHEEFIAELIAVYGEEIINIADDIFKRLKGRR